MHIPAPSEVVLFLSKWQKQADTVAVVLALALAGGITQFMKVTVGRPRPG